ncbi:putative nuclease HARBI1 [Microcaecilia unicolor]|uniref:Putative nuclease HARBI1 n=1 Tax=Microcaecilia unicolor TaxID=1415580 RepID=A0A6P7ZKA3_9AMPH|nr:putative nuclease HARBI1 [Microcaecilia unicolor]XP_030076106.1 putative nuclease HARBI1 [Microcaecilia unicolor]
MALYLLAQRAHARRRRRVPQERVFKTRIQFLNMPEELVLQRYQLNPEMIRDLCHILERDLQPSTGRSHALPVYVKVTAALNFYTSGTFQTPAGDAAGISQASMSRCVAQVTAALVRRANIYICFPFSAQQRESTRQEFLAVAGFPHVLGAVGCTHVALKPPSDHENLYRNRQRYHSMNMQLVCNARGMITHVVAEFPGSMHDATILNQSSLKHIFASWQEERGWLLGDSAYSLKTWLMTPIENPQTPAEHHYNLVHRTTHAIITQTIAALKARFRCLSRSGGVLQYSPLKVCHIFVACCVLHNIAVARGIEACTEVGTQEPQGDDEVAKETVTAEAEQARLALLQDFFS